MGFKPNKPKTPGFYPPDFKPTQVDCPSLVVTMGSNFDDIESLGIVKKMV